MWSYLQFAVTSKWPLHCRLFAAWLVRWSTCSCSHVDPTKQTMVQALWWLIWEELVVLSLSLTFSPHCSMICLACSIAILLYSILCQLVCGGRWTFCISECNKNKYNCYMLYFDVWIVHCLCFKFSFHRFAWNCVWIKISGNFDNATKCGKFTSLG